RRRGRAVIARAWDCVGGDADRRADVGRARRGRGAEGREADGGDARHGVQLEQRLYAALAAGARRHSRAAHLRYRPRRRDAVREGRSLPLSPRAGQRPPPTATLMTSNGVVIMISAAEPRVWPSPCASPSMRRETSSLPPPSMSSSFSLWPSNCTISG